MPSDMLSNPQRILAIRMDNIGDVVMLEPALRAIRKAYPKSEITLLASPAGSTVAPLIPWIDDVITWRASWQELNPTMEFDSDHELELVHHLRDRKYDLALIFTSFTQSPYPPAYACYLAGIPRRVGLSNEFGGAILTTWRKPPAESGHQIDRDLAVVKAAGIPIDETDIRLQIPLEAIEQAGNLLLEAGIAKDEPYIAIAPGASCSARRYPPAKFAIVAKHLAQATNLKVLLLGSEKEKEHIEPVMDVADGEKVVSLIGKTNITQLAAILSKSQLVLANNSASLHLADAFHRPMLILYSGTEYRSQWAPRHSPAILLKRETHCSPCYRFDCPYNLECLDIEPGEVVRMAVELLHSSYANLTSKHLLVEDRVQNAVNGTG